MLNLRSLAQALGGTVSGGQVLCAGPGHRPQDRSLSVTLSATAPDFFVVHSHAGDDWKACKDHVLERLGHARREQRQPVIDRSAAAVQLWNAAKDPQQLVRDYHALRGLKLPDDVAGRVVRYHAQCPWRGDAGSFERRTVMLTAFRSIADDRLVAVHRTLLAPDGRKLDRRMLGPVTGAAIKVDAEEDIEQGLAIGEGYESALAARQLGFRPSWATGSAHAIATFPVLSGISALTILTETDDGGANARAVQACGKRWLDAGCEVIVVKPNVFGDLNDAVLS
jgi:putative DNA primase/helicase